MSKRKRKSKKPFIPKNEFRYNYVKDHKHYIFGQVGKKFKALGLTTETHTFGKKNMPLNKNPQRGNPEPAYIRNGIISDKAYSQKPLKNYEFDKDDFANVKAIIRNYKNRERKRKK